MCTRARHPLVLAGLVRGRRHTVGIRRRPTHRPAEPASTPTASWNRRRSTTHHREPPHPFNPLPGGCRAKRRDRYAGMLGARAISTRRRRSTSADTVSAVDPQLARASRASFSWVAGRLVGAPPPVAMPSCSPGGANPLLNGRSRHRVAPSMPVEKEIDRFRSGCRHPHAGPRHPNARQSKGGQQRHNEQWQRACPLWPTPARRRGGGHLVQEHQWIGARTTVRNDRGALRGPSSTW